MENTRRGFLRGLTAAAGGLTYVPRATANPQKLGQLLATATDRERFWTLVAGQFPLRHGKVPMNAANLCPSPRIVSDRVAELTRDEDSDVSGANRAKFAVLLEESRKKVAGQLGVLADEIALVRNTSEANNIINAGVALAAGDEVVLWEQNHPSNNLAWEVRAARHGFKIKRVSVPATVSRPEEIVKLFESALTPQTKVLAITHISNTSGMRLPAKQLCGLARQRGIYAHLDGAQSWGYLNLNLKDLGCDSYTASAHKWFMGPKEAGLLYVRQEKIAGVWPGVVSAGWSQEAMLGKVASRKFEMLGQRDDAALAAVGTTVDFHEILGFENVETRTSELASVLKQGLAKINGLRVVTPMDPQLSGGVVIAQLPGSDSRRVGALAKDLYDKYGIAGAATGGLRLCPHVYNTMADIDQAIRGVRELLA